MGITDPLVLLLRVLGSPMMLAPSLRVIVNTAHPIRSYTTSSYRLENMPSIVRREFSFYVRHTVVVLVSFDGPAHPRTCSVHIECALSPSFLILRRRCQVEGKVAPSATRRFTATPFKASVGKRSGDLLVELVCFGSPA
jgi:hypothetical protein